LRRIKYDVPGLIPPMNCSKLSMMSCDQTEFRAKKGIKMTKLRDVIRTSLGLFDALWAGIILFLGEGLGSQLALYSYIFLAIGYGFLAKGLLENKKWIGKLLILCITPLSILAALNMSVMGDPDLPSYFYTSPEDQIRLTFINVGIPFALNTLYVISTYSKLGTFLIGTITSFTIIISPIFKLLTEKFLYNTFILGIYVISIVAGVILVEIRSRQKNKVK